MGSRYVELNRSEISQKEYITLTMDSKRAGLATPTR
jgi:hypothetical protein